MTTQCRICLETEEANKLLSPCNCKGSAKYVHLECLDTWRDSTSKNIQCEICKGIFKFHGNISLAISSVVCFVGITIYARVALVSTQAIARFVGLYPRVPWNDSIWGNNVSLIFEVSPWILYVTNQLTKRQHRKNSLLLIIWALAHYAGTAFQNPIFHSISDTLLILLTLWGTYSSVIYMLKTTLYLAPRFLVVWRDLKQSGI